MWFNLVRSIITINPTDTWIKFQLIDGYKPLLFIFCHSNGNHGNGIITEWNVLWLVRTNKYINMNMYYCNARCIIDVYRKKVVTITAGKQVEETNLILVFQLNFCVVDPHCPVRETPSHSSSHNPSPSSSSSSSCWRLEHSAHVLIYPFISILHSNCYTKVTSEPSE